MPVVFSIVGELSKTEIYIVVATVYRGSDFELPTRARAVLTTEAGKAQLTIKRGKPDLVRWHSPGFLAPCKNFRMGTQRLNRCFTPSPGFRVVRRAESSSFPVAEWPAALYAAAAGRGA